MSDQICDHIGHSKDEGLDITYWCKEGERPYRVEYKPQECVAAEQMVHHDHYALKVVAAGSLMLNLMILFVVALLLKRSCEGRL